MERHAPSLPERIKSMLDGTCPCCGGHDHDEEHDGKGPVDAMRQALKKAQDFELDETGLIHPVTRAIVKLRDDGAIDLFTGDVGIRIDKKTGTINLIGASHFHASGIRQWVAGDMSAEVKKSWTVKCEGPVKIEGRTVEVTSTKDMKLTTDAKLWIVAKGPGVSVESEGNVFVNAKKQAYVRAAGHLDVKAGQNLYLRAQKDIKLMAGGTVDVVDYVDDVKELRS